MTERQKKQLFHHGVIASQKDSDSLELFKKEFPGRFLVRFHMTLLLLGVCVFGLLASKILLEFGLRSMLVRYLVAVCISYGVFFLLMRIWLSYVGAKDNDDSSSHTEAAVELAEVSADGLSEGAGIAESCDGTFSGSGGNFGGGGATDDWGGAPAAVQASVTTSGRTGSSGGSGGGWDFDLGNGDEAIVLIALAILLLVIFGAGAYLVYAAPEILSEAAFQALLAAGLIKASRKITRQGWMGSVFRATCVPFLVVLLMTGVFGLVAQKYSPQATRLADIFKSSPSAKH